MCIRDRGLADKYNFRYIYEKMNFNFSRMCNIGAKEAKGDYYLFLKDVYKRQG